MSDRTHYVYRAYDEHGLLLYVGCTGSPFRRHSAHRYQSAWFPYVARFVTRGPYPKDEAYSIENQAIAEEMPYFNVSHAERGRRGSRYWLAWRMVQERRAADPERYADFNEFCRMSAEVDEEVGRTNPADDRDWRHTYYLQARNRLDRVAAEAAA